MRHWLQSLVNLDRKLFIAINVKLHRKFLNFWVFNLTRLGGATFTIAITLLIWRLASPTWSRVGLQAFTALALSHIPVAIAKKLYPRIRPYLSLPGINTFKNPLKDHSFPSGHTTAIFSVTIPFMIAQPSLIIILAPLALLVGTSRIYLGLHYPSDVLAGLIIGTSVAVGTVAFWT
jgi:undecaprenyl-diphosphatase